MKTKAINMSHWALSPPRQGHTASPALLEKRHGISQLNAIQIVDSEVKVSPVTIGNVQCLEVGAAGSWGTMIYVHGGGFHLGDISTWAGFASRLAAATQLRIILPEYRLAPENPYPCALHDLADVYTRIATAIPSQSFFMAGDSAGGGLACSTVLAARDAGDPLPAAMLLLSPWLDLSITAESYERNAKMDHAFSRQAATEAAAHYLQGVAANTAAASPILGSFEKFPKTLLFASGSEVLLDDSLALAQHLARAHVHVELHTIPAMPHVWPLMKPTAAETTALIERTANFILKLKA